jgi:hypothetical protein
LGFGVWGLGFGVLGYLTSVGRPGFCPGKSLEGPVSTKFGFRVQGLGFGVEGLGCKVQGPGSRVYRAGG